MYLIQPLINVLYDVFSNFESLCKRNIKLKVSFPSQRTSENQHTKSIISNSFHTISHEDYVKYAFKHHLLNIIRLTSRNFVNWMREINMSAHDIDQSFNSSLSFQERRHKVTYDEIQKQFQEYNIFRHVSIQNESRQTSVIQWYKNKKYWQESVFFQKSRQYWRENASKVKSDQEDNEWMMSWITESLDMKTFRDKTEKQINPDPVTSL